jgi:hypothetical protein
MFQCFKVGSELLHLELQYIDVKTQMRAARDMTESILTHEQAARWFAVQREDVS